MLHTDAKSLKERGDKLFSDKQVIDSRNQDIAEQFYPERADFTVKRSLGENFAEHLVTGYPSMVRRDLANSVGTMLRPRGMPWFKVGTNRPDEEDHEAREWLDWATNLQRNATYDRIAMFRKATKEADNDYTTFGATALSVEMNLRDNALLYRCWHLRDMAWDTDSYDQIFSRHRNWKPSINELCDMQGRFKLHPRILERKAQGNGSDTINVRHVCIQADEYDRGRQKQKWVSIYVDCENDHVMYEEPSWTSIYTTPRWGTMSINPYGVSPAAVVALPDARLLQAMTLTMLDAGERAANPPMVGVGDAIRGDLAAYPGGFTSVDADYDERLGSVLRPIANEKSGLPFGMEMLDRTGQMLREAFYLNTLTMPQVGSGPQMTAFEVGQRVQEYVRNAMPIFEPMEEEYNASLCELTFETLMRNGAFGSPDEIPESIAGAEIEFNFESPLSEMVEREKGQKFLEMKAMLAEAVAMDETVADVPDVRTALRDVLNGIGAPAKWVRSQAEVDAANEENQYQRETAQALAMMQQGAEVAKTTGEAAALMPGGQVV